MKNNGSGFTLLELIIVIGILMIFAVLSLSYYNNYTDGRKLESEAKNFINALTLASKKAQTAEAVSIAQCTNSFVGYQVVIDTQIPFSYSIRRCCGNLYCNSSNTRFKKYTSTSNISLLTDTVNNIIFQKLSSGIVVNQGAITAPVTITLKNSSLSNNKNCVDITIVKTGASRHGERYDCL